MIDKFFTLPMEQMIIIWAIGIFLLVICINKIGGGFQRKKLEQQAAKRGGRVKKGGLFSYPRLILSIGGADVEIYSTPGGKNTPPHTHVQYSLPNAVNYKLALRREIRLFGVGMVFGQDIKINNPEFDNAYIIRGDDEGIVRSFLSSEIQTALLALKSKYPSLDINGSKFQFTISGIPSDEQGFDQLIDTGFHLIKKTRG